MRGLHTLTGGLVEVWPKKAARARASSGAAAAGAERREGVGGGDEGVVRVEPLGRAERVVAVGQHTVVHRLRDRRAHALCRHGEQQRCRCKHKPRHVCQSPWFSASSSCFGTRESFVWMSISCRILPRYLQSGRAYEARGCRARLHGS
jgi:hypothetical protein